MRRLPIALAFVTLTLALPAHAQFGLLGVGRSVSIALSPAHPQPGDTVSLTAQSSVLDLSQNSIVWSAGGRVIAQGTGATAATVTVGDLGTETDVTVEATAADGTRASATARIAPTRVDLLFGSDSYTPPFYRGRALPSAGSSLVLQALPTFIRPDAGKVSASDLTYTWKRNGQVLGSLSGRGKSAIVVPAPVLYARDVMSVGVSSSDDLLSGEASVLVVSVDPSVILYEDHPLYGISYGNALRAATFIPESEMTFAAVPYFASVRAPNDPRLQYAWRVNDSVIPADTGKPNEITIQSDPTNTVALVQLALTHATNFFLNATRSWTITFSSGGSTRDQFHSTGQ